MAEIEAVKLEVEDSRTISEKQQKDISADEYLKKHRLTGAKLQAIYKEKLDLQPTDLCFGFKLNEAYLFLHKYWELVSISSPHL